MIFSENVLVCMAVPLLLALVFLRDNARQFVLNFLLGMAACLLGAYVSGFVDAASGMGVEDTAIFISPVVEEAMKFLPLLFYFLMFDPDDDHLFLSAVGIGAGFASFENICSMIASGTERLGFLLIRGLAVGVMHIVSVFAMILGLVVARRFKALRLSSAVGALSLSMLFHGIYNLLVSQPGVTSVIGYGLPLLTAGLLFLALRRLRIEE